MNEERKNLSLNLNNSSIEKTHPYPKFENSRFHRLDLGSLRHGALSVASITSTTNSTANPFGCISADITSPTYA